MFSGILLGVAAFIGVVITLTALGKIVYSLIQIYKMVYGTSTSKHQLELTNKPGFSKENNKRDGCS